MWLSNVQFDRICQLALNLARIQLAARHRDLLERRQAALRPLFTFDAWKGFERLVQGDAFGEAQNLLEQAFKTLPAG